MSQRFLPTYLNIYANELEKHNMKHARDELYLDPAPTQGGLWFFIVLVAGTLKNVKNVEIAKRPLWKRSTI